MNIRKAVLILLATLGSVGGASAQKLNPVQWTLAVEPASVPPGGRFLARFTARLDTGWHLYSLSTPKGGPIATTVSLSGSPELASVKIHEPKAERRFDPSFNLDTETFEKEAVFVFEARVPKDTPASAVALTALARYQACNDKLCLPPKRVTTEASLKVDPSAKEVSIEIPSGYREFDPNAKAGSSAPLSKGAEPPSPPGTTGGTGEAQGIAMFLLVAFGFGLAAIFTPCVFPMIPITVSFFLNKPEEKRGQSVLEAVIFCVGIVVLFSALGLLATFALGPFGVVQLGSNIWVNLFIALVFFAFGLSLLGAFELTVPSGVLTGLTRVSQRGGILGTLVMGLTFSLTAFACVGPFVGTLLAASVQAGGLRPALGMVSFATGLASPFFLLALFPSYLKRLPKSGGWLTRVKVVMGFVILAAMFKYLSAVDQVMQWNLLTRDRFLAIWIVLFAMPGLYLLGLLRLEGVKPDETVGLGRLLSGAAFLVFSISLIPGMFGARLGELDAYVPLSSGWSLGAGTAQVADSTAPGWMKNQYREALTKAQQENKLVLVSFTGYACTNCHWMKANMFTRADVVSAMRDLVPVELYTDGTDAVSQENQKLQETRFGTIAIPFYAILTPAEKVLATSAGLTRDPKQFLSFLSSGSKTAT